MYGESVDISPRAWALLDALFFAKHGAIAAPRETSVREYAELLQKGFAKTIARQIVITVKGEAALRSQYLRIE
jgi:hypothetical protein